MKMQRLIPSAFGGLFFAGTIMSLTVVGARADYQSTVLTDHPAGYWSLDLNDPQAGSGIATDLSSNGNNGSYFNISPGPFPTFNGVAGPSAFITNGTYFDGATTFVDLSTGGNPGLLNFGGSITIEAWVQAASPTAGGYIMGKGFDQNNGYDEIEMRLNNGSYHGGTYAQAVGDKAVTGGIETTNWVHLVNTCDRTNWSLYVNGTLVGTYPDTVGAINFNDSWAIGDGTVDGNNRILNGNLCQVALYTNALTPAQVLTHYFIGLDGTTNVPPVIVQQPTAQVVSPSASVTLSYQVQSLLPLTNQWYKDSIALPNQTNTTLVLNGVRTNDSGSYSVVIGNSAGATNSAAASLTVNTQPATIIWQTPQVISGASDVLTNGSYFGSWAPFNGSASSQPVNGVTFQGNSDLPGLANSFDGGFGGYNSFGSPNSGNASYDALLQYAQYSGGGGSSTFSWGGMTAGHTYEIQFWVEDVRGFNDRWENLSGGSIGGTAYGTDTSGPLGYSSPVFNNTTKPGYYITGTFVANNSGSEEIMLTPFNVGGSSSAQINLFQVRDITVVAPAQPRITGINLSGTALVITGTNGTAGLTFRMLASTNLALPLSQWTPVATNTFAGGNFNTTNTVNPHAPQNFYILKVP